MEIINLSLTDGTMIIKLDNVLNNYKIHLDTFDNQDNIYSPNDEDHTITLNDQNESIVTIYDLEKNAYIVTIVSETMTHNIVYDANHLYNNAVKLLTSYCNTCLDKQQKEDIVLYCFKSLLLDYALSNNLIEDAIVYYTELCRMLNVSNSEISCTNCNMCLNGCCVL